MRCARSGRARCSRDWAAFLDGLEQLPDADRPDAARPIGDVAGARIRKVYRRMVKMGEAIDDDSPAEDYHELRKRGKELRYLLELFGAPLYPAEVVKPMIKIAEVAAGRARPPSGPRGPGGDAALARRRARRAARRRRGADGDGRAGRRVCDEDEPPRAASSPSASRSSPPSAQRRLVKDTFAMSRVLATYNIKGGVGKTSAAVNLAYLAARDGPRTLLWDLDPQGAATYLFRVKPKVRGGGAKLVRGKSDVDDADQGHRLRAASTCCPPTSPTATWISRSTRPRSPRAGSRACSRR